MYCNLLQYFDTRSKILSIALSLHSVVDDALYVVEQNVKISSACVNLRVRPYFKIKIKNTFRKPLITGSDEIIGQFLV